MVFDGKKLRNLRLEKELTQMEVCEAIGIKENTYGYWEQGKYAPNETNINKLANFFHCKKEEFESDSETVEEATEFSAEKLKKVRLKKGFSASEIAKNLGIVLNTYTLWEKGITVPKKENINKLIKFLGCKKEELFSKISDDEKKFNNFLLKEQRLKLNMTKAEVIEVLGVTLGTYNHWEQGTFTPSRENIDKIKDFFFLNENEIMVYKKDLKKYKDRLKKFNTKTDFKFNKSELESLRKRAGETRALLASYLGVTASTVTKWEYGQRNPSFELIEALALHYSECFNEDKDEILNRLTTL